MNYEYLTILYIARGDSHLVPDSTDIILNLRVGKRSFANCAHKREQLCFFKDLKRFLEKNLEFKPR